MASFLKNYSLQNGTTLGELFTLAWASAGLFTAVFYLICYLHSQGHVTAGKGAYLLNAFWAASLLYPSITFYRHFPQFYRNTISRMRYYSSVRWLFQWSLGCIALIATLYLVLEGLDFHVPRMIESHSIKPLIFAYEFSLGLVFYLYLLICNIIAEVRGTRTSKL